MPAHMDSLSARFPVHYSFFWLKDAAPAVVSCLCGAFSFSASWLSRAFRHLASPCGLASCRVLSFCRARVRRRSGGHRPAAAFRCASVCRSAASSNRGLSSRRGLALKFLSLRGRFSNVALSPRGPLGNASIRILSSFCGHLIFGSEFINCVRRDFELCAAVENADRADILLADSAPAANHRQQPARFSVLVAANGSAEPLVPSGISVRNFDFARGARSSLRGSRLSRRSPRLSRERPCPGSRMSSGEGERQR